MPAPTALLRTPNKLAREVAEGSPAAQGPETSLSDAPIESVAPIARSLGDTAQDADVQEAAMELDTESRPSFGPEAALKQMHKSETRKILIPQHRMAPLKTTWPRIYPPLVSHLKLQLRMLQNKRTVELRASKQTTDHGALQKGEDFVRAFCLGFDVDDAIALLRLDDLYIETFEIKDVKMLGGEHLGRAIGRIAGKDGKTKFAIENASKTRLSLEGQTVHILGRFQNIHVAREAVMSLILGSPPSKVYGNLRTVASRMKQRF